ncbi:multicopper oxidase-domain-containing protein [Dactylonectria estremocensis]|uniref:Multicopper oxidase-domain-containing protein n=1 Tax=Dactylonectria estremocensis TaxID=1079267 RepID=A0A9P9F150_9HYPO|nr:multicopper oxidase-domain-containing protein [Dactylonectria estremocensis]
MGFYDICRAFILCITTFFPIQFLQHNDSQQAIFSHGGYDAAQYGPKFPAPNGPDTPGINFICKYPDLGDDWKSCSTPENRQCWLKSSTGGIFDIETDYENYYPQGVLREYYLEVDNMTINGDGIDNQEGKVFNQTYPGPWIQACWGDLIRITVKNKLRYNGTTIHWHGLRQNGTMEMDGVNGVTQCPIAPNDTFTYEFRALQYGTSWYHSHYSLQYADGLAGPITIYGPSSANYDDGKDPILITDWNHRSAFQDWDRELTQKPSIPKMNSILINGIGNFAGSFPRERYNMTVTKDKKYILRVINTSVDTTFIFSIDNHMFEVMSSDFVPIKPYNTSHVLIGIGQRYHIVLHADPINTDKYPAAEDGNYWIRTVPADKCKGFEPGNEPDERQGILRYNASSKNVPTTWRPPYEKTCRDEKYENLVPIHQWNITRVELNNRNKSQDLDIGLQGQPGRPHPGDKFNWWSFGDKPLWLNFADPTITRLEKDEPWPDDYVVIPAENKGGWIYLVITAPSTEDASKKKIFVPVAHPLHLHGHDFALLAQGSNSTKLNTGEVELKFDNPPRRDVALIPTGGYLVVAFRADNPGSWLFHCHIAWHASSGLALQILEREEDLKAMMTEEKLRETRRVCKNWNTWFLEPSNHWNATGIFQDDSGV